MIRRWIIYGATFAVVGCASEPVALWKQQSSLAASRQEAAFLSGHERAYRSERDYALAVAARSGRLEERATLVLLDCALRVASLEFSGCGEFDQLAVMPGDVLPAQQAYRRYLYGESLDSAQAARLPQVHQRILAAADPNAALASIKDPLSRLVATSVLLQKGQATAQAIALAVDTASEQGWSRPLAAWLHAQRSLAERVGDSELAAKAQRRLDLLSR
jgi:hypothetical protein